MVFWPETRPPLGGYKKKTVATQGINLEGYGLTRFIDPGSQKEILHHNMFVPHDGDNCDPYDVLYYGDRPSSSFSWWRFPSADDLQTMPGYIASRQYRWKYKGNVYRLWLHIKADSPSEYNNLYSSADILGLNGWEEISSIRRLDFNSGNSGVILVYGYDQATFTNRRIDIQFAYSNRLAFIVFDEGSSQRFVASALYDVEKPFSDPNDPTRRTKPDYVWGSTKHQPACPSCGEWSLYVPNKDGDGRTLGYSFSPTGSPAKYRLNVWWRMNDGTSVPIYTSPNFTNPDDTTLFEEYTNRVMFFPDIISGEYHFAVVTRVYNKEEIPGSPNNNTNKVSFNEHDYPGRVGDITIFSVSFDYTHTETKLSLFYRALLSQTTYDPMSNCIICNKVIVGLSGVAHDGQFINYYDIANGTFKGMFPVPSNANPLVVKSSSGIYGYTANCALLTPSFERVLYPLRSNCTQNNVNNVNFMAIIDCKNKTAPSCALIGYSVRGGDIKDSFYLTSAANDFISVFGENILPKSLEIDIPESTGGGYFYFNSVIPMCAYGGSSVSYYSLFAKATFSGAVTELLRGKESVVIGTRYLGNTVYTRLSKKASVTDIYHARSLIDFNSPGIRGATGYYSAYLNIRAAGDVEGVANLVPDADDLGVYASPTTDVPPSIPH